MSNFDEKQHILNLLNHKDLNNFRLGLVLLSDHGRNIDMLLKIALQAALKKDPEGRLRYSSSMINGDKVLECVRCGLIWFVEDQLALDLSYTQDFEGLEQLQNLEELRLYHNHLEELPQQILQLKNLKRLYIRMNSKLDMEKACIQLSHFPNLELLALENNELSVVPQNLSLLTQLKALYLGNRQTWFRNQIYECPDFLLNFRQLRILSFDGNPLQKVPTKIWEFARQQLEVLNLGTYMPVDKKETEDFYHLYRLHGLKLR